MTIKCIKEKKGRKCQTKLESFSFTSSIVKSKGGSKLEKGRRKRVRVREGRRKRKREGGKEEMRGKRVGKGRREVKKRREERRGKQRRGGKRGEEEEEILPAVCRC